MSNSIYYEQDSLWGNGADPYQVQVLADVLDILPDDVQSILDIGCGDGVITNSLPNHVNVVGLDISTEALRHVRRSTQQGSITDIPFEDRSFDLCMTCDVLEHLPGDDLSRAVEELSRVAGKYVLVCVPHMEQLEAKQTKCAGCGRVFHIHHHQSAWDETRISRLMPAPWNLREVRYSGANRVLYDPTVALRQRLGGWHEWNSAVCPDCQSRNLTPTQEPTWNASLEAITARLWWKSRSPLYHVLQRSEIMALFVRDSESNSPTESRAYELREESLLNVRFDNPLQAVDGWTIGSSVPCFLSEPTQTVTDGKLLFRPEAGDRGRLSLRFPVAPDSGDVLEFECEAFDAETHVELQVWDNVGRVMISLGTQSVAPGVSTLRYTLHESVEIDRFGLAVVVLTDAPLGARRLTYRESARSTPSVQWVQLQTGHNLLRDPESSEYTRTWGLLVKETGWLPKPVWPSVKQTERFYPWSNAGEMATDAVELARQTTTHQAEMRAQVRALEGLSGEVRSLRSENEHFQTQLAAANDTLSTRMEQHDAAIHDGRTVLDQTVAQTQATGERVAELSERTASLAARFELLNGAANALDQRIGAQEQYVVGVQQRLEARIDALSLQHSNATAQTTALINHTTLLKDRVTLLTKLSTDLEEGRKRLHEQINDVRLRSGRQVQRVLLFSHMFPHPTTPLVGTFVHEQVRSMREDHGIDARVVSCQPFWMNTFRPRAIRHGLKVYFQQFDALKWDDCHGVPTLFLPYLVGGMFRFKLHGFTYRHAAMKAASWIRSRFKFDIVHAHTGYTDGTAGVAFARRFETPLVITEHTGPFSILSSVRGVRHMTFRALSNADLVFCVSDSLRNEVRSHLSPGAAAHVHTLFNGVNTSAFKPPVEWRPDPKKPRMLFVGSLDANKNPLMLVEAFARVHKTTPGATLKIVGTGPLQAELDAKIRELGVQNAVTMLGAQSRQEVARLMREEMDFLVLCSHTETFGVVVIEALSSGKPVVSTMAGGPNNTITAPWLGELCPPGDTNELFKAMTAVIQRLSTFDAARIRSHAVSTFDFRVVTRHLLDSYEGILAGKNYAASAA
jgi:glycosyltransferase involved in cell wall biosynthesis/SAM-dependent methyltransferase